MSKPEHNKIFASDALDELLIAKSKQNSDNWLLSYLDVFVLVVMLMVTLLSMSEFHTQSQQPAEQLKTKIKVHKVVPNTTPAPTPIVTQASTTELLVEQPIAPIPLAVAPTPTPTVVVVLPTNTPVPVLPTENKVTFEEKLQLELNDKINRLGLQEAVQMTVSKGFAQLDIQDKVLFQSSAAELTDAGKSLLLRLIPLLKDSIGLITIEGHTDNRPINTSQFKSNWELSAARANSVLHFLTSQQLEPERLRAISYADTKPVADNATPLGREKNRRVNILIQVQDNSPALNIEQPDQ